MSTGAPSYCPAVLVLDPLQSRFLNALPSPVHVPPEKLSCELERGHAGAHAGLGQSAAGNEWWVQWSLIAAEVNRLGMCTAERSPGDLEADDNGCVLFDGHQGRHSHVRGQFFE